MFYTTVVAGIMLQCLEDAKTTKRYQLSTVLQGSYG